MMYFILSPFFTSSVAFSEHVEVTQSSLNSTARETRNWYQAMAIVEMETAKREISIQSGFFYAPDRLITSISPNSANSPTPCSKMYFTTGILDKKSAKLEREYRCVKDIVYDHSMGFRAMEIERIDGGAAHHAYIPIDWRTRLSTRYRQNRFELAGYTINRELMYSTKCEVTETNYMPEPAVLERTPTLSFQKYAWVRGDCQTQSGMTGGPVLLNGKAIGIVSAITRQKKSQGALQDELVWVQMVGIGPKHSLE